MASISVTVARFTEADEEPSVIVSGRLISLMGWSLTPPLPVRSVGFGPDTSQCDAMAGRRHLA
jgi:hypothetical protein